jgi:hypothetical protein
MPSLSTVATWFVATAMGTGCTIGPDNGWGPPIRESADRRETARKRAGGAVVCPGIVLKVGPMLELPCAPGAKILAAKSVRVDGRYCATVTYIAETGLPARSETLCEGDPPSGGVLTQPSSSRLHR